MAKRSRRTRRRQKQTVVEPTPKAAEPQVEEPAPSPVQRKIVNFAEEYHYVYTELRNVLIVAVLMFLLMTGLAYFI